MHSRPSGCRRTLVRAVAALALLGWLANQHNATASPLSRTKRTMAEIDRDLRAVPDPPDPRRGLRAFDKLAQIQRALERLLRTRGGELADVGVEPERTTARYGATVARERRDATYAARDLLRDLTKLRKDVQTQLRKRPDRRPRDLMRQWTKLLRDCKRHHGRLTRSFATLARAVDTTKRRVAGEMTQLRKPIYAAKQLLDRHAKRAHDANRKQDRQLAEWKRMSDRYQWLLTRKARASALRALDAKMDALDKKIKTTNTELRHIDQLNKQHNQTFRDQVRRLQDYRVGARLWAKE